MSSHELDTAATHALHALPVEEAIKFEQGIDPGLAEELASFRRVAVALTDGLPDIVPAASPELWDHISERAGIRPALLPSSVGRPRRSLWSRSAAAVLLTALAVGATTFLASRGTVDSIRSEAAAAAARDESLVVTLTSPDGVTGIHPEVIITSDGTGYVIADSLPRLSPDHTYQLWLVVDDRIVSAALLGNEPEVVEFRAEGPIAGIAISNEITGGVAVSEVPPTALWLGNGT